MVGPWRVVHGWRMTLVVAWGMACSAGIAPAQPVPGQPFPLDRDDRAGTVLQVVPGRIQVRLKNSGEIWVVAPAPNGTIEVSGSASRAMLQPKQFVQCSVDLDAFGTVTAPVAKIIFPGGGRPGIVAGGLGIPEPNAKRGGKRPAGTYLISGLIRQFEGDTITILIGKDRFVIPIAEDADLTVAAANLGLATPGDDVELEGQCYPEGQLLASSIKVALANPLSPPTPKNRAAKQSAP